MLTLLNQIKLSRYYVFTLAIFLALIFITYYILIEFCPCSNNDIFGIIKIVSLDDEYKWINGFYGPGYTLLATIFKPSLDVYGYVSLFSALITVAILFTSVFYLFSGNQRFYVSTAFFAFYLFLFVKVRPNFSDTVFVFPFTAGFFQIFFGVFKRKQILNKEIFTGIILLSWSILFRSHGLLIITLFIPLFFIMKFGFKKTFVMLQFYLLLLLIFLPFISFQIFFYKKGYNANWQYFNFYKFMYGVQWFKINELIDNPIFEKRIFTSLDFFKSVFVAIKKDFLMLIVDFGTLTILFLVSKSRWFIYLISALLIYLSITIPGWSRGTMPLYSVIFVSFLIYDHLGYTFNKYLFCFFVSGIIIYSLVNMRVQIVKYRNKINYAQYEIEPLLNKYHVNSNEVFTDDYNLYLPNYDMSKIDNFRGWIQFHAKFKSDQTNYLKQEFGKKIKIVIAQKGSYLTDSLPFKNYFEQQLNVRKVELGSHFVYIVQDKQVTNGK